MTTPWTIPRDWTDGEVPGATTANIFWRDDLSHLKHPPFAEVVTGITGFISVSSTASTAVPITAGISATITTYGGDVACYFRARVTGNAARGMIFNLDYNGTAYTDLGSGIGRWIANTNTFAHFKVWLTGLASGLYTITPTWAQKNGQLILIDASSSPLIFWVRES
jgi:hypothetical protein